METEAKTAAWFDCEVIRRWRNWYGVETLLVLVPSKSISVVEGGLRDIA